MYNKETFAFLIYKLLLQEQSKCLIQERIVFNVFLNGHLMHSKYKI